MLGCLAAFASRCCTVKRLAALLGTLPLPGLHTTRAAGLLQPPALADASAVLLPRLGWAHPALPAPLLLSSFTLRHSTSLLASPTATHHAARHFTPFGVLAGAAAPAPAAAVQASLAGTAVAGAPGELPQGSLLAYGRRRRPHRQPPSYGPPASMHWRPSRPPPALLGLAHFPRRRRLHCWRAGSPEAPAHPTRC
jgi:hypothetical protein